MTASSSSRFRLPLFAAWVLLGALAWLLDWLGERFELGIVSFLGGLAFACWVLLASVALFRIVWRRVFWSTGRRLAFSYVLVGILPLLLVASIVLVAAYMLSGFLLGHLSRDAVGLFRDDLEAMALARLADEPTAADHEVPGGLIRFADYRRGQRSGGVEVAPEIWPAWLGAAQAERRDRTAEESRRPFLALEDGRLTVAAVAGGPQRGSLVWFEGDLQEALRRRTGTWLELFRADDPRKLPVVRITLLGETLQIRGLRELQDPQDLATFYRLSPPRRPGEPAWRERPWIVWMEQAGSVRALRTGEEVTEGVAISLAASPAGLFRSLISASEQTDSTAWLVLAGFAVLLLEIWAAAAGVALFMIFGLSRAVNRLSRGTEAVARGDFSVRIPARRRDQLGDLQRSYNAMAEHLSELVETAAQKEALDKELALARQVQEDLLPDEISPRKGLEIATHFEPSSAIGGDYFDVLERPEGRVAIVIADVAGHGLAAGLRMAMVKSALELLVADGQPAAEALSRLHRLVRRRAGDRAFVTLSFADLDPANGRLELTNAGHPPCYVVRGAGSVEEIVVPGLPLGSLDGKPGRADLLLEPGDSFLLLSDGIVECRDGRGDPFGFERVQAALAGSPAATATMLVRRILDAVAGHCGDQPVEDDRTIVAVTYRAAETGGGVSPSPSEILRT